MATILRQRRDSAANWASSNPVVPDGQMCFDNTNNTFRIGNGTDTYSALTVQSGVKGDTGEQGIQGEQGVTGDTGIQGEQGEQGVSISTIIRTAGNGSAGTTDIYTITFSDASTTTFNVVNGVDGETSIPEYEATTSYIIGNAVYDPTEKLTYRCLLGNTGEALSNETYWTVVGGGTGFDYIETTDPLINTNPPNDATWINSTKGEIFVCTDNTTDKNVWIGQLGTTVKPVTIEAPTVTVEGSPTDVPESPTLTTSAFVITGDTDTHTSTDWGVYDGAVLVWESLADTGNLLSITVPNGQLSVSTEYTFKARHNGAVYTGTYGETNATTIGSFNAVYGLNWDETNDTYARTGDASGWTLPADFTSNITVQAEMKRCVLNANGTVNYFLYPTDSTLKADGTTPSVLDGTDGNVMVQIPKFYYKYNYNTANGVVHEHTLSLAPIDGGTVHPAFVQNGVEKDYRYYPAYQGSVVNDKLVSISGAYVDCNLTRATYRANALNNGTGWHVTDWLLYEAVALLMITEYGTMNMQAALGKGRVRLSGGSWADGSYYGINGNSNSDGNFSNNNTYVGDADDAAADSSYMTYRGCENVWGNVYLFLDGININEHVVYLNDNPATFADDTTTNYTDTGVTMVATNGYAIKLANSGKGFFPTDVTGGTDSTGTTDYYSQSTGWRIAGVGGLASNGLSAGPLYLKATDDSAAAAVIIGAGVSF